jgi:RimJ/RimL family protein N-acetyltransferase
MGTDLFRGELVRLVAEEPAVLAEAYARWLRDSELFRFGASDPARVYSEKTIKEHRDKDLEKESPDRVAFCIHALADDRLIGDIDLGGIRWNHSDAFAGILIGERDYWNKGYGTDAMRVLLRYAFNELNLYRVTLNTFEYNPRAIRSYEKAGFKFEGRVRKYLNREGRRWDLIYMGILRDEWQAANGESLMASRQWRVADSESQIASEG